MRVARDRVWTAWNTFWFRPEPTSTLAVVRIVFGCVATLWTLSQAPALLTFYGPDGVVPAIPDLGPGDWTLLSVSTSAPVVVGLWVATLLGAVGVTIGFRTRLATIVLFVGVVSFARRDPYILNAGDMLLRTLAFYLIFSPAGEALSLDRWRRARDTFWEFPLRAPWVLRLMQVQLSVIYLSTVWEKLQGSRWRDGTAVSYALRISDVHRLPTPGFLSGSVVLSEVMTFGTLLLEISIAIFVWNRRLRPWVLALGVSLHLSIELSMMVGFFSVLMLTTYLAFLPTETARDLALRVRARLRRGRDDPPSTGSSHAARGRRRVAAEQARAGPRPRVRELTRALVRGRSVGTVTRTRGRPR